MSRLHGSLNFVIKILATMCLVAHLVVLKNTTRYMIYDNNSLPRLSQDAPVLDLQTRIADVLGLESSLLLKQTLRRDEVKGTVLDKGNTGYFHSEVGRMDRALRNSIYERTFNTTDQMDSQREWPINALDLMTQYSKIPLEDLVNTDPNPTCKKGRAQKSVFQSVTDLDPSITHPAGRKIPKIVHVTSKTRCIPPILQENLERWKFPDHNFYLHDDAAVERLLFETYWPEFPHLNLLRSCMISGAAMADLWR
jgi:hypothetical protein